VEAEEDADADADAGVRIKLGPLPPDVDGARDCWIFKDEDGWCGLHVVGAACC